MKYLPYEEELRLWKKEIIGLVVIILVCFLLGLVIHWSFYAGVMLFGLWSAIHYYCGRPQIS